jgi:hypothetical protein
MASLGSGSWTIAFRNGDRNLDTVIERRKRYVSLKLTLASGEVPAAGVALPGAGSVGMVRNLDGYILHHALSAATARMTGTQPNLVWNLNTSGNKIFPGRTVIVSGANQSSLRNLATTVTIKSQVFYLTAVGW